MKRFTIMAGTVLFLFCLPAGADFQKILSRADTLHEEETHEQARSFLLSSLEQVETQRQEAELCWRLARAFLNIGDRAEDDGAGKNELLAIFAEGEEWAQRAIELDPGNHLGYFWKSANIGRWGQTKGILNALNKARPMRELLEKALEVEPEHADSYYVLGQLYEQVPGFPLSFGNSDYAVSLGRKSIDLHREQLASGEENELNYDFFTELAKHLYKRNWSASKRYREQEKKKPKYRSAAGTLESSRYYEAKVSLEEISDRAEARRLITWTIRELESIPSRSIAQEDDLKEAREVLAGW